MLRKIIAISALALSSVGWAGGNSVLVQAPIEKVFTPYGFDDNDKVELIIHGHFRSSCYKIGPVEAKVDETAKRIVVFAEAHYYPNAACAQMIVPFIKTVELKSSLSVGNYKIEVMNQKEVKTSLLSIEKAKSLEPDDYLYAGITSASIDRRPDGKRLVTLKGSHPYLLDGCMKFDSIRKFTKNNVLVVQPVTKIAYKDDCKDVVSDRFTETFVVDDAMEKGEYVMHVRALDGNSVNQFFTVN